MLRESAARRHAAWILPSGRRHPDACEHGLMAGPTGGEYAGGYAGEYAEAYAGADAQG